MASKHSPSAWDNHANQLNPRHPAYYRSRGASPEEAEHLARQAAMPCPVEPDPRVKNPTKPRGE